MTTTTETSAPAAERPGHTGHVPSPPVQNPSQWITSDKQTGAEVQPRRPAVDSGE
ncbi:hypothetical protein ACFYWP_02785 [Actinacidiphila glaucinigra]|uniref:hypothetical protein n=1 Tax=Actinacidiphila glaucinigra TaxID=235986 RepID=UPI003690D628